MGWPLVWHEDVGDVVDQQGDADGVDGLQVDLNDQVEVVEDGWRPAAPAIVRQRSVAGERMRRQDASSHSVEVFGYPPGILGDEACITVWSDKDVSPSCHVVATSGLAMGVHEIALFSGLHDGVRP
jgi:hypothetical protein